MLLLLQWHQHLALRSGFAMRDEIRVELEPSPHPNVYFSL